MPVESRDDLVKRLRTTTEQMARSCSAPMNLWQDHSSAVLTAATRIESDAKRIAELEAVPDMLMLCGECGGQKNGEAPAEYLRRLIDALVTAERALAEERERCARIADRFASGNSANAREMIVAQQIATAIRSGKPEEK